MDQSVLDRLKEKMSSDPFASSLGIELVELEPGRAAARMTVGGEHHNFLAFIHGGAVFTLLDFAFAAASNSHNESAVAVSMSVQYVNAAEPGSELVALAKEVSRSRKLGLYEMEVRDPEGRLIAKSDGRVYRIGKEIVPAE